MKMDKKSNEELNIHKKQINQLIVPVDQVLKQLRKTFPKYSKIDNIVVTYRDKIYDIYTELEKQNIDFWNEDFLLGDAIKKHLELIAKNNVEELIELVTEISSKKVLFNRKKYKTTIDHLESTNNYVKNYDIKNNLYETLMDYYNKMIIKHLRPKDLTFSYIIIKGCLKELNLEKELNKDQEKDIIKLIEKKELECIEYRKNINNLLELLKGISDQTPEETSKTKIRTKK